MAIVSTINRTLIKHVFKFSNINTRHTVGLIGYANPKFDRGSLGPANSKFDRGDLGPANPKFNII